MRILILIILLYSSFLKAQTTLIPDPNFEQVLIAWGHDSAPINGSVPTANIDTIIGLDARGNSISDLTGIENFNALKTLYCDNNLLTNLDLTQNTSLTWISCGYNMLTNLDVTQNTALTYLNCENNNINSLNLTQNLSLGNLYCLHNKISSLDISQNNNLYALHCDYNYLFTLNIASNNILASFGCSNNRLVCLNSKNNNNNNFIHFNASNNPNLNCIEVDNASWSTTNWTNIDSQTSFSTNCSNPCIVGIKETTNLKASFYPNPTTGEINIELGETKTNLKATLQNSLGQVVFSKNYPSVNYIKLNIEAPKGIYFLQLESEGEIQTLKILKE